MGNTVQQGFLGGHVRSRPTALDHATPNRGCCVRRTWQGQPQDLAVLRAPLHEPLPALANLERHMSFLSASKKLTAAGQGKTSYEYFEIFLETLKGFPVCGRPLPAGLFCRQQYDGYTEPQHSVPLSQVSA
jgi:hypothetical protein